MLEPSTLRTRLCRDRFLFDLADPVAIESLRADVGRVAADMDGIARPPPMLWTGIPFPDRAVVEVDQLEDVLVLSVGGTNTHFALLRRKDGRVYRKDAEGSEVPWSWTSKGRNSFRIPTPTDRDGLDGREMVERIVDGVARELPLDLLRRCPQLLLIWGFGHAVFRTGEVLLGGLETRATEMAKNQLGFAEYFLGKDVGALFSQVLAARLGWSPILTVTNDSVAALHCFLTPENLATHAQFGLFILGTGTNFVLAEPFGVRPGGVVCRSGERYQPERLTDRRRLREGETRETYFVNYETATLELEATRSPLDTVSNHPLEHNVLSGGNAFKQGFVGVLSEYFGTEFCDRVLSGCTQVEAGFGPWLARLANGAPEELAAALAGCRLSAVEKQYVRQVACAVLERSWLHAALVLAAVTRRRSFGLGGVDNGRTVPDLLGLEGSVWRIDGYRESVLSCWASLVGDACTLHVEMAHEQNYNASLMGGLDLAVLHR